MGIARSQGRLGVKIVGDDVNKLHYKYTEEKGIKFDDTRGKL